MNSASPAAAGAGGATSDDGATMEPVLELIRSTKNSTGFLDVGRTSSGKYQPKVWDPALNGKRALGSYETPEEAAAVVAKAKWSGQLPTAKPKVRAPRGKV